MLLRHGSSAAHGIGGSVEFGCVIVMSVFNLLTFNYGEGAAAAAAVLTGAGGGSVEYSLGTGPGLDTDGAVTR